MTRRSEWVHRPTRLALGADGHVELGGQWGAAAGAMPRGSHRACLNGRIGHRPFLRKVRCGSCRTSQPIHRPGFWWGIGGSGGNGKLERNDGCQPAPRQTGSLDYDRPADWPSAVSPTGYLRRAVAPSILRRGRRGWGVTITVAEAQANLAPVIAQAQAGEEVIISGENNRRAVKLAPPTPVHGRLARHPDLIGSTTIHDPDALVRPLPLGEWGDLPDR